MAGNPTGNKITNEIMYMANLLGRGQMPYAGALQGVVDFLNRNQIGTRGISTQRPPMPGLPADYKQEELKAGAAAERFRPGAGFPGQQVASIGSPGGAKPPAVVPKLSPEEQAYNQERSRIAQLTAQNPEFQNIGQLRNDLRDQGMAIWAKANPTLAAKVKPGQSGYDAIQGALAGQAAAQGYGYQMPQQMIMTPPPGVSAPQGLPSIQSFNPAATYGAEGIDVDPEMRQKFQALLNQAKG